ncbi:ABC transporter ATP-binding protein [Microvirga lotononidis]|uniref:ATPase component of ABC-type sugar transporter n=1 Tax=Microvirga lotononidis TaxID=864069 RepID=I4YWX4_9HYPH|nr:sn-glycerol-3-phosphate ABC transporter ATP-binding protein UgpC [Microvirga lotononidis]EIM28466.1 ATPase component of ABC-type sugar transporter [Microvirga lotononidis]WQO27459.1 sn-glycerol-3-phosphate ABC transporter ATP-binding protein UgpC [Microvirga lotononidis]
MADVVLKNVQKSFGRVKVIHGVDLDVRDGEFVVFVGPSGCGKSTLLRLIAGLEDITAGELFIDGERVNDLVPARRGIAMVFQSYALYPHMNVYDNMAFGLELAKASKAQIDAKVREAARLLQIDTLLDRKPRQLSGGQRQRVAIGRAIVRDPKVFLFDEPLSNLDAALRVQTRIEIAKLHNDTRATMIYVTHDQVEAMTLADRIVVLNGGRIEQVGTPLDLYHRPANLFVAGFIGSPQMNFIECQVAGVGPDEVLVSLPSGGTLSVPVSPAAVQPGERITLGVRPDHVRVSPQGGLSGRVELVEELGENHLLYVDVGQGRRLTVREPGDARHGAGSTIALEIDRESCHLFKSSGEALPSCADSPRPAPSSPDLTRVA